MAVLIEKGSFVHKYRSPHISLEADSRIFEEVSSSEFLSYFCFHYAVKSIILFICTLVSL
jgi:hypothetical protein